MTQKTANLIRMFSMSVMFLDCCMYAYMRVKYQALTAPQFTIQHWKFIVLYMVIVWVAGILAIRVSEQADL